MNEYGVFMDYTAIDEIPATIDPMKQDRTEEVVTDVLRKCKNVDDAINYISQFNLTGLTGARLFRGDASGDYAIVHGSYTIRPKARNFALTNYPVNNNHYESCWKKLHRKNQMISSTIILWLPTFTAKQSKIDLWIPKKKSD